MEMVSVSLNNAVLKLYHQQKSDGNCMHFQAECVHSMIAILVAAYYQAVKEISKVFS